MHQLVQNKTFLLKYVVFSNHQHLFILIKLNLLTYTCSKLVQKKDRKSKKAEVVYRYTVGTLKDAVASCILWQYELSSFQAGNTKLERFLPKIQHKEINEF